MVFPQGLPIDVHEDLDAAARDPHVHRMLELVAGRRPTNPQELRRAARALNERRGTQLREEFIDGSLTSREVATRLGVRDRRAVQARRARRTLLGWTIGNETYHPDWQFSDAGTQPGLARVVTALSDVTSSPITTDRIMRRTRDDLDGRALTDLLAVGRIDLVVRLIAATDA